ncbi:MAG TPA: hypothetical protein VM469_16600 [Pseudoxanthomonas sp.]|nr:hypothetical protein [Pseudoxanthomonas sp.]
MPRRAQSVLLILVSLASVAGCQRQAEPAAHASAPPATATPGTPAPAPAAEAAAPVPTEAALAEVRRSMDKFLAARSFHAVMTVEGSAPMQNELDFVAPDRYRMAMPVGTQVIIGDTMYMDMHGQRTRVPIPEGTISGWRDPLKIEQNRASLAVEFLGEEQVGEQQARKFRVLHSKPEPGEFLYWVDREGLPLQLRTSGEAKAGPYTMTLQYSRFDDPSIAINAP